MVISCLSYRAPNSAPARFTDMVNLLFTQQKYVLYKLSAQDKNLWDSLKVQVNIHINIIITNLIVFCNVNYQGLEYMACYSIPT